MLLSQTQPWKCHKEHKSSRLFKITVQCKLLHKKHRQFISQQPGNSDPEKRHRIYQNGMEKHLNYQNVFPWSTSYDGNRSLSQNLFINKKKSLTTAPTVCTWQQFFWCLISIRLLCAQTEAAYRYWIGTRLETEDKEKQLTHLFRVLFHISKSFRKLFKLYIYTHSFQKTYIW